MKTEYVFFGLIILCVTFYQSVKRIYPVPHESQPPAAGVLLGTGNTASPVAGASVGLEPVVRELQAEIAAREAQLDELSNALNSAIAERNEAVALLQQLAARKPNS